MIVFYHSPCSDGFCAAWVWHLKYPEAEYVGINYNNFDPVTVIGQCIGKDVVILDFSFKRPLMEILCKVSRSLICLDHHKTAKKELEGIDGCVFDMNLSGAQLAWDFLFTGAQYPWIVAYVADRDLWKWELKDSREINNGLKRYPFDFDVWSALDLGRVREVGYVITPYLDLKIASKVKQAEKAKINGRDCLVTNCTDGDIISDVAGQLAEEYGMGATFFVANGRYVYSLRGENVSETAEFFGGGGHAKAAGFSSTGLVHH